MKYMTFNSSCSYAGVANMLQQYGVDTDDRTIALSMKLPYLFARKNGVYMAGPMLQSSEWFNLFLNPIGFQMVETEVPAMQVSQFLKQQQTAMLGLQVDDSGKHAVVYIGNQDDKLVFLNNKWAHTDAPERIVLTEPELLKQLGESAMVATMNSVPPRAADLADKLVRSIAVIRENLAKIRQLSSGLEAVGVLRSKLNPLFRPLLLDGITMLTLIGENDLAQRFTLLQRSFLNALRQAPDTKIVLGQYLSLAELTAAAEEYIRLIEQAIETHTAAL